jgi:hypothetical protein
MDDAAPLQPAGEEVHPLDGAVVVADIDLADVVLAESPGPPSNRTRGPRVVQIGASALLPKPSPVITP